MRSTLFRRAPLGSLVLLGLAVASLPTALAAQDPIAAPAESRDDDGFNEGLLGLAGLAGLLGLKRRERNDVKREINTSDLNRGATSRV